MAVNAQTYYALRQTIVQAIEAGQDDNISEETWEYILDKSDMLDAWYKITGLVEAVKIAAISVNNGHVVNGKFLVEEKEELDFVTSRDRKLHNQKLLASQNGK